MNVKGCNPKIGEPGFDPSKCEFKAHVDCAWYDNTKNNICGYPLDSTFDKYVNEGWYGLNKPQKSIKGRADTLLQRKAFYAVQGIYGGSSSGADAFWTKPWFVVGLALIAIGISPILIQEIRNRKKTSRKTRAAVKKSSFTEPLI